MVNQTTGKVPRIRFGEFSRDWHEKTLGELFPITSAARVHKNEWTTSGVPFFRSSDVVSHFKGEKNTKAFISVELYQELSAKVGRIKRGDILVTGGGSIGIPFLVRDDAPLYFKDADLLWFKARESADGNYLYTSFSAAPFRRYLKSISHIGTIAHYTVEQAKGTPITLPSELGEQAKIGAYFCQLDELIELHQRKHEKLEALKAAMLQKMFPKSGTSAPEVRFQGFSGDWEKKKLGELMPITSAARVHKHQWTSSGVPFFRTSDVVAHYNGEQSSKAFISPELFQDLSKKVGRIRQGDILITGGGSIGVPYLVTSNEPLYFKDADLLWLKVPDGIDDKYLYSYFCSGVFSKYLESISHIGTIGHYTIEQAKRTPINIPGIDEQKKIGSYFFYLAELIAKHAVQIQKIRQIKSAFLEEMFA